MREIVWIQFIRKNQCQPNPKMKNRECLIGAEITLGNSIRDPMGSEKNIKKYTLF